jgi:hypothetical protein
VYDSIMAMKTYTTIEYVHGNVFPGQGKDKVYVFKMLVDGPGSGVDLIKRMQPGGDLENAWLMFDHVKRVKEWTTMACHVYDAAYCKVMTIAVCDLQSEDTKGQCIMWRKLNDLMAKNSVQNTNFKGFMADSAPLLDYIAETTHTEVYQAKHAGPTQSPLQAIQGFQDDG